MEVRSPTVLYARLMLLLAALVLSFSSAHAAQRDDLVANKFVPPEVGEIAPPIGSVRWLQVTDEDQGQGPDIERLRGRVLILQTYGHYCDP